MSNFIDVSNDNLSTHDCRQIFDRLQREPIRALCLRDTVISDKNYKNFLKVVATSNSLRHLSLSVQMIQDTFRVQVLAQHLHRNLSLSGLFLHGNSIRDQGLKLLQSSLLQHPGIVSLDFSDCQIGDTGLECLCGLLQPSGSRPGLRELVFSDNPDITANGWTKFGIAMAAGNSLKILSLDFNDMGDSSVNCVLAGLAGRRCIEHLDMECVGATDVTGKCLLHLVQNYHMSLMSLTLDGNAITPALMEEIKLHIPGLLEHDQLLDVVSDDDQSLATSEPPLDTRSDTLDGMVNQEQSVPDTTSNTDGPLAIIGTSDSLDTTPIATVRDADNSVTDDIINDVRNLDTEMPQTTSPTSDVSGATTLAERIQQRKLASKSDINISERFEEDGRDALSTGPQRRYSSCSQETKHSNDADKHNNTTADGFIGRPQSATILIEVKAKVEPTENNPDKGQNMEDCSNQVIIHETPSVVSLHRYGIGLKGMDDATFLVSGSTSSFERPRSAPNNQTREPTVVASRTSSEDVAVLEDQSVKSNSALLEQFGHKTLSIPNELNVLHARRRLSGGNILDKWEVKSDGRRRLSVASATDRRIGKSSSSFGDVELQDMP